MRCTWDSHGGKRTCRASRRRTEKICLPLTDFYVSLAWSFYKDKMNLPRRSLISFLTRRCVSSESAKSPKTGSSSRTDIAKNIAKNFNNISLINFPLMRPKSLGRFKKIQKADQCCLAEHLDDNPNYYPSISTVLNQTMSPESINALKRWEAEKIK